MSGHYATYFKPVFDTKGRLACVCGADITFEWLTKEQVRSLSQKKSGTHLHHLPVWVRQPFATGVDLYTGSGCAYWGGLLRYGLNISKWYNIGAEVTSSFDLNNSFKFSYLTSALYMNDAITNNGSLFWCSNTWWVVNKGADNTFSNYEYLGYTIQLKRGYAITPMVGAIHSWKFDQDADVTAVFYYTFKNLM